MGKVIMLLSFVSLTILVIGSLLVPGNPIMWLAASSGAYMFVRSVLMAFLVILLITNPPRDFRLRTIVGVLGSIVLLSVFWLTYENKMSLLDTLSLLGAGVSLSIAALEFEDEVSEFATTAKKRKHRPHTPALSAK